ncbi:uncharacterized protein CTRU02_205789 [Colletotrichum truncatum]|uniref:Uncharacterized protein n=1 Tax=Colletotrichum truncatum TaxID=5467 RepID=A0ACC3Z508_COLTU|nr:uncharacterized protein CTRU02_15608 [Colletotrichum truncatum]KAF6780856.1 hypothetical protein CTRU02_15608 [Colletotrichum truncatum]
MEVPDLERWWYEPEPEKLRCLVCQQSFGQNALIRTFRVASTDAYQDRSFQWSKAINTHMGSMVLLFDRHLECIHKAQVPLFAISHVWDPKVSITQQRRHRPSQPLDVRRLVVEEPMHIFRGCQRSAEGYWELWHDYLSVPQWTDILKNRILQVIPDIFNRAHTTTAYLDDVHLHHVHQLQNGKTLDERLSGITGICKAKWFKRMWTAMEFVRSRQVRMMVADYLLLEPSNDPMLLNKLHKVYDEEVQKSGDSVYSLEARVNMISGNLVPWCLGPLREIRFSQPTNFGMAFALLSKWLYRDGIDFLHALRGITRAPQKAMTGGFYPELVSIAKDCLLAGDYSPLLLTPKLTVFDRRLQPEENYNFNDVWTWYMGNEVESPLHPEGISLDPEGTDMSVKLQSIGVVDMIIVPPYGDPWSHFAWCIETALTLTGPNLDPFIATLGSRLFGANTDDIIRHLKDNNLVDKFSEALQAHRGSCFWKPWQIESLGLQGDAVLHWLADALLMTTTVEGFSHDRLELVHTRFNTMHCGPHAYIATITCSHCRATSLFRVGLYAPTYEVRGAHAWRIPGLQYQWSHRGGMAILEKNGLVVGRMMWATPSCDCQETEVIELQMPDLPDPRYYIKWGDKENTFGKDVS